MAENKNERKPGAGFPQDRTEAKRAPGKPGDIDEHASAGEGLSG